MFETLYNSSISRLEACLKYKYWYLYTALLTAVIALFLSFPSYFQLTAKSVPCSTCVDFKEKINRADHILKPDKFNDADHMAKTQFRITIAVIAKLTGIRSMIGMFIIQEILGIVFLVIACLLTYKFTDDRIVSAIITLSLGFIYAGKAAFVDTVGFTDSFAYCFLIIALFSRYRVLIIVALIAAYFTDERAIVSSVIIGVFYFVEYLEASGNKINLKILAGSRLLCILIALVVCFAIRYWLSRSYGFYTPTAGASIITLKNWDYFFWEGLQGFWLIVIGACIYLFVEKRFFILFLLLGYILAVMLVTSVVADLTRSIAYIFPVIFFCIYFLEKGATKTEFRKIAMLVCLVSFLSSGSFFIAEFTPTYYQSLPVKIIEKIIEKK